MNKSPVAESPAPEQRVQLLFVRHEGAIRTFVRALLPSLNDADDVMQETFLTITHKADSFNPETTFVAWACAIARLKVLEHFGRRKQPSALSEAAINALADHAPALETTRQREAALARCVDKLAPKTRDLLWRRYSSRQSSEEIASESGMTSTAVRMALFKARAFLRNCVSVELKGTI